MEALADGRLNEARWRLAGIRLPFSPIDAWIDSESAWSVRRAFAAATAGAAAAGVGSLVLSSGHGDASLQPYLYWCLVLGLATWGGLRAGLVAVLASVGMYATTLIGRATMPLPEHLVQESIVSLLIAIIVGEASDRRRRREASVREWSQQTRELVRDLQERNGVALDVINELGRRIADQTVTIATIDAVARRLDVLDTDEVLAALLDTLRLCLRAESASVLLMEDGLLQRKAQLSSDQVGLTAADVSTDPLVRRALTEGRVCHVRDLTDDDSGARPAVLMAAPLVSPSGTVSGVVTIEQMPLLNLNASATRDFEVLVGWGARSFFRAAAFREAPDDNARTAPLSFPMTMRGLWSEIDRARRYGRQLSILVVGLKPDGDFAAEERGAAYRAMADSVAGALRAHDMVGYHHQHHRLICVLPETSADDAAALAGRIQSRVRALAGTDGLGSGIAIGWGAASLGEDGANASTAYLLAAADAAAGFGPPAKHGETVA